MKFSPRKQSSKRHDSYQRRPIFRCGLDVRPGATAQIGYSEYDSNWPCCFGKVVAVLNVISLGAGVQSSTMALMAAHRELEPMPDCGVFADTGWEPRAVYEWLDALTTKLPFPLYRVSAGNLKADLIAYQNSTRQRFAAVPWFMKMPNGDSAMGRRQCTKEYKIRPIQRKIVELCDGRRKPGQAVLWIGISTDEASRMKDSRVKYIKNRWPLIEKRMSRNDCLNWLKGHGYLEPPKSACIGCPFHNDSMWRDMKKGDPESWNDAVKMDRLIRHQAKMKGEQFMHRKMVPLDQVDFSTAEDRGQLNMFINECEGMCGV